MRVRQGVRQRGHRDVGVRSGECPGGALPDLPGRLPQRRCRERGVVAAAAETRERRERGGAHQRIPVSGQCAHRRDTAEPDGGQAVRDGDTHFAVLVVCSLGHRLPPVERHQCPHCFDPDVVIGVGQCGQELLRRTGVQGPQNVHHGGSDHGVGRTQVLGQSVAGRQHLDEFAESVGGGAAHRHRAVAERVDEGGTESVGCSLRQHGQCRDTDLRIGVLQIRCEFGDARGVQSEDRDDGRRGRLLPDRRRDAGAFLHRRPAADQRRLSDGNDGPVHRRKGIESGHRHEVRFDGALEELHVPVLAAPQIQVVTPFVVPLLGKIGAFVVQPPAALGPRERTAGRHFGAVPDERDLRAAHQLVRGGRAHPGDLPRHPLERLDGDRQLRRRLRRRHIVVDEAAQLVLDLRLGRAVRVAQRPVDQLVRGGQLLRGQRGRRLDIGQGAGGVRSGEVAVDECADHVVVGDAGQVACGVQPRDRGGAVLVHPHPGRGMSAAQADLGDVHLDVVAAVVVPAVRVERAAGGAFGGVQDRLERVEGFLRQVADLEIDGAARGFDLALDLAHHLPRPVVGVDEPLPLGVDLVAAERVRDVRAGRAVVVLDQGVDLEALDAAQFGARVVGHRVTVARVGGVLVGAVEVPRRREPQPAARAGREDDRFRADRDELARAGVQRGGADGPAVLRQDADGHQPVLDADLLAHLPLP
ncbi:hypothetical protein MLGJGCBP_04460 [Rhodococcus sp. T7]|nr:hypothetical protein MLGJGCBP_04460 [Rhodococcus sp. T7]